MNSTGFSFFNHEDFVFTRDEEEERQKKKALLENTIKIVILNKQLYRGDKVCGIVKIHVVNELPKGQIEIKCESSLNFKIRKDFKPLKLGKIIQDYKESIQQVELRKPFEAQLKAKMNDYTKRNQIAQKPPLRKFKSSARSNAFIHRMQIKMNRTKLSNNPNVANKGNKMNNGNFGKLVGVLKNKSRKQIHVLKENQLQEKRYMLKSQVMVLFTLRNKIDTETILIVPFQISIPENFPISYNQKLLLSQVLNLKMKRDCLLKDKEFFNTNLFGIEGQNLTQEGVSIEHKLIAYYVSKHNGRVRQSDDSVPVPIPTTNASAITKIVSEEKFEVYHRMKNIDFQKAVFEGKLTANREDGKTCCMGLIKRNFNFKLKISLDRLTFRNRDSAINIVINYPNKMLAVYDYIDVILVSKCKIKAITYEADIRRKLKDSLGKMIGIDLQGLKEVHEEDMKEKEKAKEIAKFRSMNIEHEKSKKGKISLIQLNKGSQQKLKAKPTSRKNISRKVIKVKEEELTPKSKNLLFTRMNIQQPENKSSPKVKSKKKKRNIPKPKVSMKTGETKASVNQKLSLKSLQSEAGDFEEDDEDKEDAEGFKSIERLVYATSLDLIGKRKVNIDMDSESINYDKNITELVHKINISDIKVALETVQTEYMSLDYNLIFFASVGPLGFNKKIKEIPMRFVALPKEFGGFKHDICTAWNNIEKKISQVDYVFMLPHAKVKVR